MSEGTEMSVNNVVNNVVNNISSIKREKKLRTWPEKKLRTRSEKKPCSQLLWGSVTFREHERFHLIAYFIHSTDLTFDKYILKISIATYSFFHILDTHSRNVSSRSPPRAMAPIIDVIFNFLFCFSAFVN